MCFRVVLLVVALAGSVWFRGQQAVVPPEVGAGINALGDDLLRVLGRDAEGAHGNLIFSPVSISTVFAMSQAGARARTAAEIQKAMRFPADGERLHGGYARLAASLRILGNIAGSGP